MKLDTVDFLMGCFLVSGCGFFAILSWAIVVTVIMLVVGG